MLGYIASQFWFSCSVYWIGLKRIFLNYCSHWNDGVIEEKMCECYWLKIQSVRTLNFGVDWLHWINFDMMLVRPSCNICSYFKKLKTWEFLLICSYIGSWMGFFYWCLSKCCMLINLIDRVFLWPSCNKLS